MGDIERAVLDQLHGVMADSMEKVAGMFKEPDELCLTFYVRDPRYPDGSRDVLVTNEKREDAAKVGAGIALRLNSDGVH